MESKEKNTHEQALEWAVRLTEAFLRNNTEIKCRSVDTETAEDIGRFVKTLAAGLEG